MIDPKLLVLLPTLQAVAQTGGFAAAAGRLGVSPSAVSQSIRRLEELIGVRLFERTSRSVRLSDAGAELLAAIAPALETLGEAVETTVRRTGVPSGALRITLSRLAAEICIVERLAGFVRAYPSITLELTTDDHLTDIVAAGFDAGIRMREALEKDMVARPIGPLLRRCLLASPDYLSRFGTPTSIEELEGHKVIRYRFPGSERLEPLRFRKGNDVILADPTPSLVLDDNGHIARAAREGLGIAQRFQVSEQAAINSGALVELMPQYEPAPMQFFVYYPSRRRQPAKLKAFLDWFCHPTGPHKPVRLDG